MTEILSNEKNSSTTTKQHKTLMKQPTWKKMGMPQANIAMKYISKNVPGKSSSLKYWWIMIFPTSPILVAKIWKAPNIAEPNGDGDAGEEEVELVGKRSPLCVVVLQHIYLSSCNDLFNPVVSLC